MRAADEADLRATFERWRRLRAWGCIIGPLEFDVLAWRRKATDGTAYPDRIILKVGTDLGDAYATILHELAHVAAYRIGSKRWRQHGDPWRRLYERAVVEVVGLLPLPDRPSYGAFDQAVGGCLIARKAA